MAEIPFKERVVNVAIQQAQNYKDVFVDYDYLICSQAFSDRPYYVVSARADNYRHLVGVSTDMSAADFFKACLDGTLTPNDISFVKKGRSEKEVKGSVRKKIKVLPKLMTIFEDGLVAQEKFAKNRVSCAFATTDCILTVGFIDTGYARPMTLLEGDELNWETAAEVDLVLRRAHGAETFDTVVYGSDEDVEKYREILKDKMDLEGTESA